MIKKPMLAGSVKSLPINFPVIASPKLDGIRCLKRGGQVVSRTFKPIRNDWIRTTLEKLLPEGADGEIMVGDNFQDVSSGVMSKEGCPGFRYHMFDLVPSRAVAVVPYESRLHWMADWKRGASTEALSAIEVVPTTTLYGQGQLDVYEAQCLEAGFEGVMLRDPEGPYKEGRSTEKQGWLLKLKRFTDAEAVIVGFEEQMHNTNTATTDALGHLRRSTHKDGKVGKGTLGKFIVESGDWSQPFRIGTGEGLTDALRQEIWDHRGDYMGLVLKYRYQPHGCKDAPRIPICLGFRDAEDM